MFRKQIKAITVLVFLLAFCFTLSACDPGNFQFTSDELASVTSIELISYDNPEQKHFASWVPDHTSDLKPFDDTKASRLEVLDDDKISDFLDELCEYNILYKYFAYDSPNGTCLKLNYRNGDFLIVWSYYQNGSFSGYIGRYSSDGEVAEFFGCFESLTYYKNLVNDYFQIQI